MRHCCRLVAQTVFMTALLTLEVQCFAPIMLLVANHHSPSTLQLRKRYSRESRLDATCLYQSSPLYSSSSTMNSNRHSSSDWLYNIQSIPSSAILKEVRHPVFAVFTWSALVAIFHKTLSNSASAALRSVAASMQLTGSAHSSLVSALGLLLVFRTNSAYQRFQVRHLVM